MKTIYKFIVKEEANKMLKSILTVLVLLTLGLLTACGGISVRGRGDMVSRQIDIDSFTKVNISGGYNVIWRQTSETTLEIEMQENLFRHLNFYVADYTLFINTNRYFRVRDDNIPRIYITSPALEAIFADGGVKAIDWSVITKHDFSMYVNGGAMIDIELDVYNFALTVNGSASANIIGNATNAVIYINGATNVNAAELRTINADVSMTGSSMVYIYTIGDLTVDIYGSGLVRYLGEPNITQRISGIGLVESKWR